MQKTNKGTQKSINTKVTQIVYNPVGARDFRYNLFYFLTIDLRPLGNPSSIAPWPPGCLLPVVSGRPANAADFECLVGAPDAVLDAVADLLRVGGEADVAGDVAAAMAGADALVD